MKENLVIHERSYKKKGLISLVHKSRLQAIHGMFERHVMPHSMKSWADFGCSNGFIAEEILKTKKYRFTRIVGFDHTEELLAFAREKRIPNTEFRYVDLNEVRPVTEQFDVVTCFETLEHVGNPRNAFVNLVNHLEKNGVLIITLPNETGLTGLVKFLGRLLVRRNPYEGFFDDQSSLKYLGCLLRNDVIDGFRKPNQPGYGPHLGFDYRTFEQYIQETYIKSNQLRVIERRFTRFKMNVMLVFR